MKSLDATARVTQDGNGNTRLIQENRFYVHVDYLRTRYENMTTGQFAMLLEFFGVKYDTEIERPWSPGAGAVWYANKLIGTQGFVGGFTVKDEGLIDAMIDLPGEYWEQQDAVGTWRLFLGLKHTFRAKCSRIDLAIDDPTYSHIPVLEMEQAWRDGNNFLFRKFGRSESGTDPKNMSVTRYYGSRESGRYSRVYDHDGECMRHETEFKRKYAHPVFDAIASLERTDEFDDICLGEREEEDDSMDNTTFGLYIQRKMSSYVLGAIDFRSRTAYQDASRVGFRDSERIHFYQQYIDTVRASHVRVQAPKEAKSLSRTVNWFKRQCSATLALIASSFDTIGEFRAWVGDYVVAEKYRMNKLQTLWVEELKGRPHLLRVE